MDLKMKKMHDYACINPSLEGPELFGPPKILAQLRLCFGVPEGPGMTKLLLISATSEAIGACVLVSNEDLVLVSNEEFCDEGP